MEASSCSDISEVHLLESDEQEVDEGKYWCLLGVNKPTLRTISLKENDNRDANCQLGGI